MQGVDWVIAQDADAGQTKRGCSSINTMGSDQELTQGSVDLVTAQWGADWGVIQIGTSDCTAAQGVQIG